MGHEPSLHNDPASDTAATREAVIDGALNTLTSLIRVTGEQSFPIGDDHDVSTFHEVCSDFARHVENGSPVPEFGIQSQRDGSRDWQTIQRVLVNRRRNEKAFVGERLGGYRELINELVSGFRQITAQDLDTSSRIQSCLNSLHHAVGMDELPMMKSALSSTIAELSEVMVVQKNSYESQLAQLKGQLANLKQDLVVVREEMQRDSLTQTFNRGAFDLSMTQSLNLHYLTGQPITLLMIDLDNFKQVNDRYGHTAGDDALRAFSDCLCRSFIRKNDLVARYGGDEFAVILADTPGANVHALAERLLDRVAKIEIEANGNRFNLGCSVGYTDTGENDTVDSMVARADQALYAAKTNGRGQSVYLSPESA